jgi:alkylhydroperoxidase family enzyme
MTISGEHMNSKMEPMFLPEVEKNPQPSFQADTIRLLQAQGAEYPQILHLFAYRPGATAHLTRFTREVMRGESPLSAGFRELIAAYTSAGNDGLF